MALWQLPAAELLAGWFSQWWWPFVRLTAAFWAMPLLGDYRVTVRLRLVLGFLLALLVAPMLQGQLPPVDPLSPATLSYNFV